MRNKKERGTVRCCFDGFLHLLISTNFYNGYDSLGNKIMNWTMYKPGPVDKPLSFALGFFSGIGFEIAFPIYITSFDNVNWYTVLLGNIAIKTIPRGLEVLVRKSYNYFRKAENIDNEYGHIPDQENPIKRKLYKLK